MIPKGSKLSEEHKRKIGKANKGKRGEKSGAWKGGVSPIHERIRRSLKYKEWKQRVLLRDDFTCQKCGMQGGKLEVHHKKTFNKLLQEVKRNLPLFDLYEGALVYTPMWEIKNGMTLCQKCHNKTRKRKK